MWSEDAQKQLDRSDGDEGDDDDDDDDDDEEEESDEDESGAGGRSKAAAVSREDRKKEKKARKEAAAARARGEAVQVGDLPPTDSEDESSDDEMPVNPNHTRAARSQAGVSDATAAVKDLSIGTPSRKERESIEAQQAKERYRQLHEQGKTDEAKADLARLKLIREKRDAEAARKQVGWPPRQDAPSTSRHLSLLTSCAARPRRRKGKPKRQPRRQRSKPRRPRSEMLPWGPKRKAKGKNKSFPRPTWEDSPGARLPVDLCRTRQSKTHFSFPPLIVMYY